MAGALFLGVLVGCDGGGGAPDTGPAEDAGPTPSDASVGPDAGGPDGGVTDAGAPDAGPPPVVCDDAPADVFAIDPATVEAAAPGEVLACAVDGAHTREELEALITAGGVSVTSGAERFLIAYRTERRPGVAGVGSARLFVPDVPAPDAPVVIVNHGTAGHADMCAPSSRADADPNLVLPWVASGMTTLAVDYAGLGTLGTQGYGDAFDTAQSVLDGARATLRYLREDRPIIVTGHSQGGGATLYAQGLAPSYAPELQIRRVIPFAGGTEAPAAFTPAGAPFLGLVPITGGAGVPRAVFAMTIYADFANLFGEARAGEGFHPSVQARVVDAMENDCILAMALGLAQPSAGYSPPRNLGELLDPPFLSAVQDCITGDAGCTTDAMAFVEQRTTRSFIGVAPAGGDVLMISGSDDTLFTSDKFACVLESVRGAGANVDACYLMGSNHFDITANGIGTAVQFALDGTVSCPASAVPPPACP